MYTNFKIKGGHDEGTRIYIGMTMPLFKNIIRIEE